jgi:hypothetical protein
MNEILNFLDHTRELEEKFLPKFPEGTSQHSLLKNRIRALQTARELISGEGRPSREELEFALPRIESMIHKMSKARDKYEPGSRNYKRFDPTVQAMKQVRTAIVQALEG